MSIWNTKDLPDPKSIKALAIDLDGTVLAPGAVLSERTARTINLCAQRGLRIIITTGRAIEAAEPFRSAFAATGPMVYYNGAVVVDTPGNKILNTNLMDKKAAQFCADLAMEMGVYCQVYIPASPGESNQSQIPLLAGRDYPERGMYHKTTGMLAELADLKEALACPELQGCVKTMFLAEPEVLAAVRPKLEEHLGKGVYIAQTHRTFLEVMDARASKGTGLEFVMEYCSLKKEEVIAFGDEENDTPMFGVCGFSVAPGNAKDCVKAAADLIIASNAEDGVAAFLENFFKL
jgi:hypothetical protein